MKIWAHRGCSQRDPENTRIAFEKAMEIKGLEGIELDVQLTKDGELVVIHDERVDRTTEGIGYVKDYTLAELKRLHIYADAGLLKQASEAVDRLLLTDPDLAQPEHVRLKAHLKEAADTSVDFRSI